MSIGGWLPSFAMAWDMWTMTISFQVKWRDKKSEQENYKDLHRIKRVKYKVTEGNITLGGEYPMQYTNDYTYNGTVHLKPITFY